MRLPKGSYLKVVVPPFVPGITACTSRFSNSQVKLRPWASERVLPFASSLGSSIRVISPVIVLFKTWTLGGKHSQILHVFIEFVPVWC